MLKPNRGRTKIIPTINLMVWSLISAFLAISSVSSSSVSPVGRITSYPIFLMAEIISSKDTMEGKNSTESLSEAKLIDARLTPVSLFTVFSIFKAQLAQLMPVTGISFFTAATL